MFKNLKLTAPIVFFDLETTGVDPDTARIVELAWLKIEPDGAMSGCAHRIDPGILIPESASAVHGIRNADVKDCLTFEKLLCCPTNRPLLFEHRLAGYNVVNYDIPILYRELNRANEPISTSVEFSALDVMQILHRLVPYQRYGPKRTLGWAYEKFVGRRLEGAHGAMTDTRASAELLDALIAHYKLPDTVEELVERFPVERKY